jgi:uncharacterized phage protein (TIGR02220 family)
MAQQGFIMLHRSIQQHWIYDEKRKFSNYEAWLDLLMMVNHKDNKVLQDGELVEVKRGERITSIRQLMDRWTWSNTKVVKFLNLLKSDNMIEFEITPKKKTLIKIVKYHEYQGFQGDEQSEKKTQKRQRKDTETTQNNINNNDNNANNENKKDNIVEIIDYLNGVCNKKFKATTEGQVKYIRARLNEGNSVEDLKSVIDKKAAQWLGSKQEMYLRPSTLFNSEKFEGYLNENSKRVGTATKRRDLESELNFDE